MMSNLINFLSNFPSFESEKNLILYIESYLAKEYLIKPILAFSIYDKLPQINLKKCRIILAKDDRLKSYDKNSLDELIKKNADIKKLPFQSIKGKDEANLYYVNLGLKNGQFHFVIFSTPVEVPQEVLTAISQFSTRHLNIIQLFEEAYKSSELIHIDDVTGLYNQRKLHKDLAMLVDKFQKEKDPFSVLFIDIDYFKKVNDTYGHLVGTRLLEQVSKDIKNLLRDSDISYRYGGDEFVVILTNTNATLGKMVGERILKTIKDRKYEIEDHSEKKMVSLSVSIGVAELPTDASNAKEILAIADRMMYEAKGSGRGLVFNTQDIFKTGLKDVSASVSVSNGRK